LLEEQYIAPEMDDNSQQAEEQAPADVVDNQVDNDSNDDAVTQNQEDGQDQQTENQQPRKRNDLNERFRNYSRALKEKDAHIRALEARLNVVESPQKVQAEPEELPPNPEDPKYKTVNDYIGDLTRYQARKILKEEESKRRARDVEESTRREMAEIHADWNKKLAQAQEKFPDWNRVVEEAEVPASPLVGEEILKSEKGPDIAYFLAKNQDILLNLNKMPREKVIREIAKLEVNLGMKQSSPLNRKPAPPADLRNSKPAGKIDKSNLPMDQFYKLKMAGKI